MDKAWLKYLSNQIWILDNSTKKCKIKTHDHASSVSLDQKKYLGLKCVFFIVSSLIKLWNRKNGYIYGGLRQITSDDRRLESTKEYDA